MVSRHAQKAWHGVSHYYWWSCHVTEEARLLTTMDCIRSSMTIFNRRFLDVSVPSQLEYVQKTNFSNYVKGETQTDMMQDALGQGIFATDGRQWTRARKAMSHAFTASTFKTIITASLNSNLATLDSILTKRAQTGKEFDLQALFFAFTLSTFTQIG